MDCRQTPVSLALCHQTERKRRKATGVIKHLKSALRCHLPLRSVSLSAAVSMRSSSPVQVHALDSTRVHRCEFRAVTVHGLGLTCSRSLHTCPRRSSSCRSHSETGPAASSSIEASMAANRRHRLAKLRARRDPELWPSRPASTLNFLACTRPRAVKDRSVFVLDDAVRHPQKLDTEVDRQTASTSPRAHEMKLVLERES